MKKITERDEIIQRYDWWFNVAADFRNDGEQIRKCMSGFDKNTITKDEFNEMRRSFSAHVEIFLTCDECRHEVTEVIEFSPIEDSGGQDVCAKVCNECLRKSIAIIVE